MKFWWECESPVNHVYKHIHRNTFKDLSCHGVSDSTHGRSAELHSSPYFSFYSCCQLKIIGQSQDCKQAHSSSRVRTETIFSIHRVGLYQTAVGLYVGVEQYVNFAPKHIETSTNSREEVIVDCTPCISVNMEQLITNSAHFNTE